MTVDSETKREQAHGHEVIFTADSTSRRFALDELGAAGSGARLIAWLAPEVGRAALTTRWDALVEHFREQPPIFCRHVYPVHVVVPLQLEAGDVEALAAAALQFRSRLRADQPFSVQTRILGEGVPYAPYDINTRLAQVLIDAGGTLDVREPVWALSIVLTHDAAYLGFSRTADNLSDWAGGARRFRREEGQISRAEFKLLEALDVFKLRLPEAGAALDLGAAPGGWTRLLIRQGLRVVAVDPADLHPALEQETGVDHVRKLAQDYLPGLKGSFDVVLNDMRVDAVESAWLMRMAIDVLKPGGWALMTLKLPKHNLIETMTEALEVLRVEYTIIGVRQLFHNRSEVTVALRRPKP
jgi:23S rRNA (cytidine2498-2'-O)-methyltransferase